MIEGIDWVRWELLNAKGWGSGVNFDLIPVPNLILCCYENI